MLLVGVGSAAGRILQVNATMTEFTGLVPEELGVLDVHAIVPWADRDEFARHLDPLLDGAVTDAQFEHRYLRADGGSGWGRTTATRVVPEGSSGGPSEGGAEPYLLCLVEDVTARKAAESALVHQAQHDALTGLPNRVLLRERLEAALHDAATGGGPVGVLVIDLDGFKAVNDSAGHAAGDALLREVASRLATLTRAEDTVARLGGDEFAVVCPGTDAADLERLGRRVLDAVREPVDLPGGTVTVGVSVGSAVHDPCPGSAEPRDGGTPDRLLQNADLAMYAAKRAGKNRSFAYDHRDRERLDRAERLLPELAAAVGAGEFEMFGQPIVDLGSGRVDAVETLLRWRRADGTVLAPGAFLDVLEASPLMPAVGEFVLCTSCELAAQWERALGADAPAVHVNVSAEQLGGSLAEQVDRVLAQTGLSAHLLVLELTETHTTRITDALLGELETVRARGCGSPSTTSARVLRARPADRTARRPAEDRPAVRRRAGPGPALRRRRARRAGDRPGAGDAGGRRGRRDRCAGRPVADVRGDDGAGLPLRPPGPGRRPAGPARPGPAGGVRACPARAEA